MILFLVAALLFSAPAPEPVTDDDVFLELVGSFSQPLYVTAPDGDERLFVVERGGRVQVVVDDQVVSTYLDVSHLLPSSLGGEQGLLGLAFHPDFASNGKLYIAYTNSNGDVVIAELVADPQANTVDISTRRTILINEQPFTNHNGGMVLFGPDGYLYIGSGDGGSGGDPDENGQNTSTILGALLRIDVDGDDFPGDSTRNYAVPADNPFVGESGADEIWVYGLRNPWRFWIDPPTGQLFIGDVGQNDWEEVTVLEPGSEGANLGWDILEGTHCFEPPTGCSSAGTVLPQIEYPHDPNASVTGGVVYRGSRIPQLRGTYFYADFLQDFVRSFRFDGSVTEHLDWSSRFDVNQVSSFGTDGFGEMYIVSLAGPVYRVRGPLDNDEIFFYRGDGTFRYYDIAPDASLGAPILSGSGYSPGWSSITAVNLDGDGTDEMFFYRDHDGAYRYYETQPDGSLGTRIRAGDSGYSLGWSSITAVDLDGDGQDEMFFYRDHDGAYRYYDIQPDASLGALLNGADSGYSLDWDAVTAVDLDGDGQDELLFYRGDGTFKYYRMRADGTFHSLISSGTGYSSGWSSISAIDLDGDADDELLFYRNDGTFKYYRTSDTGVGSLIRSGTGYSNDWSSITSVNLDG